MSEETDQNRLWVETFYRGLRELVDSTFPKQCTKCGRVFDTKEQFLAETEPVKDITLQDRSGLFSLEGGPVETSVGLFRNCVCGTTLMADFQDRRDKSAEGARRREQFSSLMDMLSDKGMPLYTARMELLRVLGGGGSDAIEKLIGHIEIA